VTRDLAQQVHYLHGPEMDLASLNRAHVAQMFRREQGNKLRTAKALGISRRSLYRLLEKYRISLEKSDG
jgi:DNA-binding NtrC family response regulator